MTRCALFLLAKMYPKNVNSSFLSFYTSNFFFAKTRHKNKDNILIEQVLLHLKLMRSKLGRAGNFFYWPKNTIKTWILAFLSSYSSNFFKAKTRHEIKDHILIEQVLLHPKLLKPKLGRVGNFSYLPKCTLETWF